MNILIVQNFKRNVLFLVVAKKKQTDRECELCNMSIPVRQNTYLCWHAALVAGSPPSLPSSFSIQLILSL